MEETEKASVSVWNRLEYLLLRCTINMPFIYREGGRIVGSGRVATIIE